MARLKLSIAYDGTAYHGWQVQDNTAATIQQVLQDAFATIAGEKVNVTPSGRTDAGVHAREQVALVVLNKDIPLPNLLIGINSLLPEDIAVTAMEEVPDGFHPRYSAKGKHYRYVIRNSRVPDVFERKYSWLIFQPLDVEAMKNAASRLVGTHDFTSFRSSTCCNKDPVKTITKAEITTEGETIYFDVVGSGFLKQMVRTIVGTLVEAGKGKMKPEAIDGIISSRDRGRAGQTAPPQGLFLMKVHY